MGAWEGGRERGLTVGARIQQLAGARRLGTELNARGNLPMLMTIHTRILLSFDRAVLFGVLPLDAVPGGGCIGFLLWTRGHAPFVPVRCRYC